MTDGDGIIPPDNCDIGVEEARRIRGDDGDTVAGDPDEALSLGLCESITIGI